MTREDRLERTRLESMEHFGFGVEAMKKIKVCTRCGNPQESHVQFCIECGLKMSGRTIYDVYKHRHRICRRCDTVVSDETEYCPACGAKIRYSTP